ncbi:hypothetical protein CR513_45190, partial [Mucuna pruriens]
MPLRLPYRDSLGQRDPVRVLDDRKFLHPSEDKTMIHVNGIPLVEWTGLGGQLSYPKGTKEATQRGEREVGQRASPGLLAIISVEIGESSPRIALFQPAKNGDELKINLDLLQEAREGMQVDHKVPSKHEDRRLERSATRFPSSTKTENLRGSLGTKAKDLRGWPKGPSKHEDQRPERMTKRFPPGTKTKT